jgi:energy-coupling factor transport system substrate-specific component
MTWQLGSTLIVAAAVLAGLAWYELRRPPAKLVALVAALAALAVAGRVLFAAIPNVQATTDVALLTGYALGPAPGFVVGAIAALASNVFLGQGPWTPWEMLGWGVAGIFGAGLAALSGRRLGRLALAVACALAGFLFGAWMDLFTLVAFTDGSTDGYLAISAVSLPFNIAHAIGNFVICLVFGPAFVRMLVRFRLRLTVRWRVAAAPVAMLVALGVLLASAPSAFAGSGDAIRYLERAQHRDGGFGATPTAPSSQLITGWAVLGLEAAGRNPLDRRGAGKTAVDYLRSGAGSLRDIGEIERTILALRGAGVSARRFGGRDLVGELLDRRRSDGSWNRQSNWTAFGILALRASGWSPRSRAIRRSSDWLERQQNTDGGFSFGTKGGGSFVDETGAALQALAAAGAARGQTAKRAVSYLRKAQNTDGGFGQSAGQRSNAQSTAWAVQGLAAARANPRRGRGGVRSPVRFLTSLQQADGSFRYSRSSTQTPVWVTAQALAAVRLATLPYPRAPRRATQAAARQASRPAEPARAPPAKAERARRAVRSRASGAASPPVRRSIPVRPAASVTPPGSRDGDDGPGAPLVVALGAAALAALGAAAWRLRGARFRSTGRR